MCSVWYPIKQIIRHAEKENKTTKGRNIRP